ncbi:MAG: L-threonine 3-dehydrogenase [Oscillospiraceae bacterium]|nr:L-threonine 3-dehydrogenase [Oscillospiraceae bacterium]
MKKILVTGALGQIGSELVPYLRDIYGKDNIIASDKKRQDDSKAGDGIFEILDVMDRSSLYEMVKKYNIDTIIHMAALLSAVAEEKPQFAWQLNMNGFTNTLGVARENNLKYFVPSSIAAFGPNSPKDNTPQDTIQRPTSMYGITKLSAELLCDYYHLKYGLDTRSVRFPGLISYVTPPGGGTTDYAVKIYYDAIKFGKYSCYLREDTYMDMMYMPDAIKCIVQLMESDPSRLKHRNAFNVSAMSFSPKEISREIKKIIPEFTISYDIDEEKQKIADSWPNSIDCTCAIEEWDFKPEYDLASMTKDMIDKLKTK